VTDNLEGNLYWGTAFIGEESCLALLDGGNWQEGLLGVDTVGDPEFGVLKGISENCLSSG
jgi:hypothetical protein